MSTITANGAATASLQVFSTPPVHLHADCMLVAWSRRSTKTNPVDAGERYRGVVIDRSALAIAPDACASKFQRLLQSTIHTLADAAFTAWAKDNMNALQYDGVSINVDTTLAFWAEQKQREVIDGAAVLAWLKASATYAALSSDQKREAWAKKLPKIAAPSYQGSFTAREATVIIASFADEDAESPAGLFILQRLNNIAAKVDESDAL